MTDQQLMQSIRTNYGAAIVPIIASRKIPPAFVAALIANETGGNPHATRFEKDVLATLWEVLLGRKAAFGSIAATTILAHVAPTPDYNFGVTLQRIDSLATSWGLTQIMGYQVLQLFGAGAPGRAPEDLTEINFCFDVTARLLTQFAAAWRLDPSREFEQLFRCWNTGHPEGKTADADYVANGLRRMELYPGAAA